MSNNLFQNTYFSEEPISTFLFVSEFRKEKTSFIEELLTRTWGPNNKSLWVINNRNDFSITDAETIIQQSLQAIQNKVQMNDFQNFSTSFRLRCGELRNGLYNNDLNATYILLSLDTVFLQRHVLKAKLLHKILQKGEENYEQQHMQIQNIYLLVANHQQAVLTFEVKHTTLQVQKFITDIHPLYKFLSNCYLSLREKANEAAPPIDVSNMGYLANYISRTQDSIDSKPCPLLGFIGWLLHDHWDCPENVTQSSRNEVDYPLFSHLVKNHFLYRMHSLKLNQEDWELKEEVIYYVRRGANVEKGEFFVMESQDPFVITYPRKWDHIFSISRDGFVSIGRENQESSYHFGKERFQKSYLLLTLQVLLEYMGCQQFNYKVSSIAYKEWPNDWDKKRDSIAQLLNEMNQFRLGVNLVDFSIKASESRFYAALRQAFTIDVLLRELSDEIEDVHSIINEQDKKREYQIRKAQEENQRNKEKLEESDREEREKREREERERQEQSEKKKDQIISLLGAATIPFALIGGLMGMNTDLDKCGTKGVVPCISFWGVVGICLLLSCVIYIFLWRSLQKRK